MSRLSRIVNVFRRSRVEREIDEELADHLASAVEMGRDRAEAERALGSTLRHREASADVKVVAWLDSLRADAVFGLRQLRRRPTATVAAIVSLALAIGAVTTAFRLIDAVLLRPLPVANPESLFVLAYTYVDDPSGRTEEGDSFSYPLFRRLKDAAQGQADLMVVTGSGRVDLTYAGDEAMERAYRQRVSGTHFEILGVKPALGRLFTAADDVTPGGHPVAVLTHDYWTRRFGRDPKIVGKTFRHETALYEIVGVAQEGYLGTNTGAITDFFVPAMQNKRAIDAPNWGWMNVWMRPRPGVKLAPLQQRLQAAMSAFRRERTAEWGTATQARKDDYINRPLLFRSAAAGASYLQQQYRQPLTILAGLVLLVLLIACANVANLLTAQAAARGKEMALRVSIGSGRARLVQLMLMECLLLALGATVLGGFIAWKAAPFVVAMINPADNPVQLYMPADWRVLGFAAALALGVTMLFGLIPALRASCIQPTVALKGGDDPHSRRRLMNALVAVQVAFCFLVHFGAGLFVASFNRLAHQPTGFTVDGVLALQTEVKNVVALGETAHRPQSEWYDLLDRVRQTPGVNSAGVSSWALMSGNGWSSSVYFPGRKQDLVSPYFLAVTPGWLETMGIGLMAGRDFRAGEMRARVDQTTKQPLEGPVIVNELFVRKYFGPDVDPLGRSFETNEGKKRVRHIVAGVVRDAQYRDPREPILPTVYVPFADPSGTIVVRVKPGTDPLALVQPLRRLVTETRAEYRVTNAVTQAELVHNQTLRERLLATLSLFFAAVALILAAVGLYGVMHYAVVQRRREIGIRIALGAPLSHVARQISADVFLMLLAGSAVGMALGLASEQYVKTLLYEVKGADFTMLATPFLTLLAAALLAAVPPVMNAARTNPLTALRSE